MEEETEKTTDNESRIEEPTAHSNMIYKQEGKTWKLGETNTESGSLWAKTTTASGYCPGPA